MEVIDRFINQYQRKIQQAPHLLGRLGYTVVLFGGYIALAAHHAAVILFLPSPVSFQKLNQLRDGKGYTTSYVAHQRWKHNLRFATLSYSLVMICGISFITVGTYILFPNQNLKPAYAATLTVNTADNTTDGVCGPTTGQCTLGDALAEAETGDTITFADDFNISITETYTIIASVTLDASNHSVTITCTAPATQAFDLEGPEISLIDIDVSGCTDKAIGVTGRNFTYQMGTITNSGIGIYLGDGGDHTITNASFGIDGTLDTAIQVAVAMDAVTIENTVFNNITQTGIEVHDTTGLTITGNTLADSGDSDTAVTLIDCSNCDSATITTNTIDGISNVLSTGISLSNDSDNTTIATNTFTDFPGSAIVVTGASDATVIAENTITGDGATGTFGINVTNSDHTEILGNTISQIVGSAISIGGSSTDTAIGGSYNQAVTAGYSTVNTLTGTNTKIDIADTAAQVYVRQIAPTHSNAAATIAYGPGLTIPTAFSVTQFTPTEITGTTLPTASLVDLYGSTGPNSTFTYLTTVTTNSDGTWNATVDLSNYTWLGVIAVSETGTSIFEPYVKPTSTITVDDIRYTTTSTAATIQWTTPISTTADIMYATTAAFTDASNRTTTTIATAQTEQSVTLTELDPATAYSFIIHAVDPDQALNFTDSTTLTFNTTAEATSDTTPPQLSHFTVTDITDQSAVIRWLTDEPATGRVLYGTTASYTDSITETTSASTTNHAVTLTGLEPNTTYHYRIMSDDKAGQRTYALDRTFTTTTYAEAVVKTITVVSASGEQVVIGDGADNQVNLAAGDIALTFDDSKERFGTDYGIHLLVKQLKSDQATKEKTIFNQRKAFTKKGEVQFKIKQDRLAVKEQYTVYSGLVKKHSTNYQNPSGLKPRFTFKVVNGPPTIIEPANTIVYGMPERFIATTQSKSVTFTLTNAAGDYVQHCTAQTENNVAACAPAFGVAHGQYTLTAVNADGGQRQQTLVISDLITNDTFTTDTRSAAYWQRITYAAHPRFVGLTTGDRTVALRIPGVVAGDLIAEVKPAAAGVVTSWNFGLNLVSLPVGVHTITIVEYDASHTIVQSTTYPIFRTPKPVTPAVVTPATNQRFALFAPTITVIGHDDHVLQVFQDQPRRLLYQTSYSNGQAVVDLSEWYSALGSHNVILQNKNSLGLTSGSTTFSFITYRPRAVATRATTQPITVPVDDTLATPEIITTPEDTTPVNLTSATEEFQNLANTQYDQTATTTPIDYPLLTQASVVLTPSQIATLQEHLTTALQQHTTVQIIGGTTNQSASGSVPTVTRSQAIEVSDVWRRITGQGRSTTPSDNETIMLTGQITDPLLLADLADQPVYVIVTVFSRPTVQIAQADSTGRWTMTIPAELLAVGDHAVYAATEVNGVRSDQVQVARFVIEEKQHFSKTTWLVLINLGVALVAVTISVVLQLRHRRLFDQTSQN